MTCVATRVETGARCEREAVLQAVRPDEEDGTPVELPLCRQHYEIFRVNRKVGARHRL